MKRILTLFPLLLLLTSLSTVAYAGWQDFLSQQAGTLLNTDKSQESAPSEDSTVNNTSPSSENNSKQVSSMVNSLSKNDMSGALKQALNLGVKKAVDVLGKDNGFLGDSLVKIAMPSEMKQVDKVLRMVGQDKIADNFIASMNHAAEKAVPKVSHIFADSIKAMTIEDAKKILTGPDNAATQYFKDNTSVKIKQLISPYIKDSMSQANVAKYYKMSIDFAKQYDQFGLLNQFLNTDSLNVEDYVANKTMSGLFSKIAINEKSIRQNPAFRQTDLLKKVFSKFNF